MIEHLGKEGKKTSFEELLSRLGADENSPEWWALHLLSRTPEHAFEEELVLRPNGTFHPTEAKTVGTGVEVPMVAGLAAETPEQLRQAAQKIQERFPEIQFEFSENPARTRFTYKVSLK